MEQGFEYGRFHCIAAVPWQRREQQHVLEKEICFRLLTNARRANVVDRDFSITMSFMTSQARKAFLKSATSTVRDVYSQLRLTNVIEVDRHNSPYIAACAMHHSPRSRVTFCGCHGNSVNLILCFPQNDKNFCNNCLELLKKAFSFSERCLEVCGWSEGRPHEAPD